MFVLFLFFLRVFYDNGPNRYFLDSLTCKNTEYGLLELCWAETLIETHGISLYPSYLDKTMSLFSPLLSSSITASRSYNGPLIDVTLNFIWLFGSEIEEPSPQLYPLSISVIIFFLFIIRIWAPVGVKFKFPRAPAFFQRYKDGQVSF